MHLTLLEGTANVMLTCCTVLLCRKRSALDLMIVLEVWYKIAVQENNREEAGAGVFGEVFSSPKRILGIPESHFL